MAVSSLIATMNTRDEQYFKELGVRIAQASKDHGLTQQELAEQLGVAQQTLAVSLDELFGTQSKAARASGSKRGPVPQWQQHIEAISRLPRSRQQFVSDMLRNVLGQGATG